METHSLITSHVHASLTDCRAPVKLIIEFIMFTCTCTLYVHIETLHILHSISNPVLVIFLSFSIIYSMYMYMYNVPVPF